MVGAAVGQRCTSNVIYFVFDSFASVPFKIKGCGNCTLRQGNSLKNISMLFPQYREVLVDY